MYLKVKITYTIVQVSTAVKILIVIFWIVTKLRHEADHSLSISAEVKKMWIYTSTLPYALMA
jgi:hypothetical protein